VYGYRIPFEFRLSTRLMFAAAMFALVNLAPVNKGRAADDTLSSGNKNQMMIYGIVTRAFLYADDGNRSELFHVDGGVENTRFSWIPRADGTRTSPPGPISNWTRNFPTPPATST